MKFFRPTRITWIAFGIFIIILILGASHRAAFLDDANDRPLNPFYASLPDFMQDLPLWEFWTNTIGPIVIMLGGNIWFYGGSPEPALFIQEIFFITSNIVYYYVISCSLSYVINKRKHGKLEEKKMKTRYKIIIPLIVILAIGLFYLYIVANGYTGYIEGIEMIYFYETDPEKILKEHPYLSGVTEITDEGLEEAPRIKGMLKIALEQEFPLKNDGYALFDGNFNSYWLNRDEQNIHIQIGMSNEDTEKYANWLEENLSLNLMKYQDRYFMFRQWVA